MSLHSAILGTVSRRREPGLRNLTSLDLALMSQFVVETKDVKGKPTGRWYFFDMKMAAEPRLPRP
jgi:hypothetical protein